MTISPPGYELPQLPAVPPPDGRPPAVVGTPGRPDRVSRVASAGGVDVATFDLVIPVHNEHVDLEPCVRRVHDYLTTSFPFSFRITVADNASTDGTVDIARALAAELPGIRVLHLDQKGRGRALRAAWSTSDAPVLGYLDVDLSTDLAALLPLVAALVSGHSDLAIGTRLSPSARVVRGPKRELISRCYNLILRSTLAARFSDAQCGFKAIRRDAAEQLLPLVEDMGWFFDTELLVLAEAAGMRIHEVPVDWVDDPDSRVDLMSTARADLLGVWRLGRALASNRLALPVRTPAAARAEAGWRTLFGQLVRFALIGAASTVAYLALFLLLRNGIGAQAANGIALLTTAVANTAANRRFTFGLRGRRNRARHQVQGLLVFALGLALTSGALTVLQLFSPGAERVTEVVVLVAANLAATLLRFLLFRGWVFAAPTDLKGPAR